MAKEEQSKRDKAAKFLYASSPSQPKSLLTQS